MATGGKIVDNINVLHLCSYYYGSKLYENLFKDLGEKNIKQTVYIPIKYNTNIGEIKDFNNCSFLIKETSNNFDRLFFYRKAKKNYDNLISEAKINAFNIIHAHTLFTNGYIGYKLYKKYKIPYIVAVRNTDVNIFLKYFIHLRKLGVEILLNAKKIIFISPSYMDYTISRYVPDKYKNEIQKKSVVIPNGINEYWVKNRSETSKRLIGNTIKLCYVGEITKNKNVHKVIEDIEVMKKNGKEISYDIVGDGDYLNTIKELVEKHNLQDCVNIFGKINDKDKLKEIFNKNDIFVMTSSFETFGLSYIEALSQGIPVIYTKGQGIYGYYKEGHIGYAVENGDSIIKAIDRIESRYEDISKNAIKVVDDFKWNLIGDKYKEIYDNILD
jgi:glycosyltransferase involved in cell wall biosynthesis